MSEICLFLSYDIKMNKYLLSEEPPIKQTKMLKKVLCKSLKNKNIEIREYLYYLK